MLDIKSETAKTAGGAQNLPKWQPNIFAIF